MKIFFLFLSSSVLIIAVLLIRKLFRKQLSAGVIYALWLFPLLRLMIPFGIGEFSSSDGHFMQTLTSPYALISETIEQVQTVRTQDFSDTVEAEVIRLYDAVPQKAQNFPYFYGIWGIGSILLTGITILKNRKLQKSIEKADFLETRDGISIYACTHVTSPCLINVTKPKILVPSKLLEAPELYQYALQHELAHYKGKDHLWTAVGILLLIIYWWSPFVWAGVFAAKEDAELACDARVLKSASGQERRNYGYALLELIKMHHNEKALELSVPLSGGKKNMTKRIEAIITKPKTKKKVLIPVISMLLLLLAAGCAARKGTDRWILRSSFEQDWDEENNYYVNQEYNYQVTENIKSKLLYYEVYEYGVLTDRHTAAYGTVENGETQALKLCLKNAPEAQTLIQSENEGAETSIPLLSGSYLPGSRSDSSDYSEALTEIIPEKEMILLQDIQGSSTGSSDLENLTERQILSTAKDTERMLLVRLVFSELSEDELYKKYEKNQK